ncbi:MAG: alpha/beta fold hydrolase [Planctomycetota bacterium]|jgi:pimeloyl-ACP methyl ester carboxylesterase
MRTDFETRQVSSNGVQIRVAVTGKGPLVILVHGFPELWYSWRHQIHPLAAAGYRVVAPDLRGYGGSDKPHAVEAYSMRSFMADLVGLIDAFGEERAVLIGHDWGAPICWNTAILHSERVRAVAGLSVPFLGRRPISPIEMYENLYAGRFFYQLYFQREGVAEAELEADVRTSLRKIYYAASGDSAGDLTPAEKPPTAGLLDGLEDPDPFPSWISEGDLEYFIQAFESGGFRGPLNRYRCQQKDWEQLLELSGARVGQPSFFLAGTKDLVRDLIPGSDLYADPAALCDDFRGQLLIEGMGHWIQQEAPVPVTAALLGFLDSI